MYGKFCPVFEINGHSYKSQVLIIIFEDRFCPRVSSKRKGGSVVYSGASLRQFGVGAGQKEFYG